MCPVTGSVARPEAHPAPPQGVGGGLLRAVPGSRAATARSPGPVAGAAAEAPPGVLKVASPHSPEVLRCHGNPRLSTSLLFLASLQGAGQADPVTPAQGNNTPHPGAQLADAEAWGRPQHRVSVGLGTYEAPSRGATADRGPLTEDWLTEELPPPPQAWNSIRSIRALVQGSDRDLGRSRSAILKLQAV